MALTSKTLATVDQDHSYDFTVSPDGRTEAVILLHSRMGIRAEFNLHKNVLELWISPKAGRSVDYRDRNFSCRDDHTTIFDRIQFPELGSKRFERCDYDPFHSVLHFGGQQLHLATLIDQPAVLIWTTAEEVVDFKSDKQDTIADRSPRTFCVRHPDRSRVLEFAASLGAGRGVFAHQPETDTGRSTYARVVLAPRQLLVVAGELASARPRTTARTIARQALKGTLSRNETLISRELLPGTLTLRGHRDLQKLYDINKRHLLSAQDASGAIRASLKYVYYLIWTTDGSVTSTSMFQTGYHQFLRLWLEFLLANPTTQNAPPHGRFFAQLTNGRITKREEFGSLCAVWPAFSYWALTGDPKFMRGGYLKVLEDAVDWVERYCWDAKVGALGTFYQGGGAEDPFVGSNDFGWDAAVGCPMSRTCYAPQHDGAAIRRTYEFGMNLNQYNMHLMLAAATTGRTSSDHRRKAARYARFLEHLLDKRLVGYYVLEGRGMVPVPLTVGREHTGSFAVQHSTPSFFTPRFTQIFINRMRSFEPYQDAKSVLNKFACTEYGRMAGLDTEFVSEDDIVRSLELTLPCHITPSRFIPMPWTMAEVLGATEGEYHDIRPQAFSAGPYQSALTNLLVRTMPMGIALRGSRHVARLEHYEYLNGWLDVRCNGTGSVPQVTFNGTALDYTLQIPVKLMRRGANEVRVRMGRRDPGAPVLVFSTVKLNRISSSVNTVTYHIEAIGSNGLVVRNLAEAPQVRDRAGKQVHVLFTQHGRHGFVEFDGAGEFTVTCPAE